MSYSDSMPFPPPVSSSLPTNVSNDDFARALKEALRRPMPQPSFIGVPLFSGRNVSNFLKKYALLCDEHGLSAEERIDRLPDYCDIYISHSVRLLCVKQRGDWDKLCKELKRDYRNADTDQLMYTWDFLKSLVDRGSQGDLRAFCRQYEDISGVLRKKGLLEEATQCMWFLKGLSSRMAGKVLRKARVDLDDASTMKF